MSISRPVDFDYIEEIKENEENDTHLEIPSHPLHIKAGTPSIRHPKSHRTVGNCQATSTVSCPFEYIDTSSMLCMEKNCEESKPIPKKTPSDSILQSIRESLETIKNKKNNK